VKPSNGIDERVHYSEHRLSNWFSQNRKIRNCLLRGKPK
jgi:hypothetical protein